MVQVRDEGSRFDASIQTIWRYLNSPESHGKAHAAVRNAQSKPIGDITRELTMERQWMGKWVKVVNRITVLPPLGIVTEFLEGPFAGSKMFTIYTAEDEGRTRVDVFGEFVSPVLPPDQVDRAARVWLEESYNEDAPALTAL